MPDTAKFIRALTGLHPDAIPGRWRAATMGVAPHKPLLLISVIDEYLEGPSRSNRVEPTLSLEERFDAYWTSIGESHRTTMALPFFHLEAEKFWTLIAVRGMERGLNDGVKLKRSMSSLRAVVQSAVLDSDLHLLLVDPAWASHLRSVLVTTYFVPELHECFAKPRLNHKFDGNRKAINSEVG